MTIKRLSIAAGALALAACAHAPERFSELPPEAPSGVIRAVPMPSAPLDRSKTMTRIVFASCAQQNEDQRIWNLIATENPGLFLFIGDNVYGDVRSNDRSLPELKAAYMRLALSEPFARLRASTPVLAVWDDHDFGLNDGGGDYPLKEQSEQLFEYVWNIDADDARAGRPGVYGSWMIGEAAERVQVIMLDTRYFRSPLKPTDEPGAPGKQRWLPDADPSKTMLGEAQWSWLEAELIKPAALRLLVSSIQVMSEGHGYEAWRQLPLERERLYDVIRRTGARDVFMLSGDRHAAAIYERTDVVDYPLVEATSSSLNLPAATWRAQSGDTSVEIDPGRIADMIFDANYGRIDIDWATASATVSIRAASGEEVIAKRRHRNDRAGAMMNIYTKPEMRWTRADIEALFALPFADLIFQAQTVLRENFAPNEVQASRLLSIKTGGCAENCGYCSQSAHFETAVKATKMLAADEVVRYAKKAKVEGASRFCMGAAWRSPKDRDLPALCKMISEVKALGLETCMTLGMLSDHQARALADAGLDYYNHNIDTSPDYYDAVVTTRTFEDRIETLARVRAAGMKVCCGGIVGMGEQASDRVGLILALATMDPPPESVPVNALVGVAGTPLGDSERLSAIEFARIIAVARITMPRSMVRLSAGREQMSEEAQALALLAGANSIFIGDELLTTRNPGEARDAALFGRLGVSLV